MTSTPTEVLVVEDSPDQRVLLEQILSPRFRVRVADSFEQAVRAIGDRVPDLLILDVSLPDGDGFQLLAKLQEEPRTAELPVLFLTARSDVRDKVLAFSLGADDYLVKPVDPRELRARIERRLQPRGNPVLVRGPLRLDVATLRAWLTDAGGEQAIDLTPHEFRILHLLAGHEARVFSRSQLLAQLWENTVVTPRTVDTHVSNLRNKLGRFRACIHSVRGVGYRFETTDLM